MGLAPPFGVATNCPIHCMPRVAQEIRAILTYRRPFLPPAYAGSLSRVHHLRKGSWQLNIGVSLVAGLNQTALAQHQPMIVSGSGFRVSKLVTQN